MTVVIETERLYLRQMCLADLDFVASMLADSNVMRFYPKTYNRDESRVWLDRQLERYERDGHGLWLVEDKSTRQALGQVGLAMQPVDDSFEPEIGYLIHYPYWRRGYAYEAALGTREYAFQTLDKAYVISLIRPINLPSQAVAHKLGMKPVRRTMFRGIEHLVFMAERDDALVAGNTGLL